MTAKLVALVAAVVLACALANDVADTEAVRDYGSSKKYCYRKFDDHYHDKHGRKRYMNCCRYYYRCWHNGRWTYDYCYHEKCDDYYSYSYHMEDDSSSQKLAKPATEAESTVTLQSDDAEIAQSVRSGDSHDGHDNGDGHDRNNYKKCYRKFDDHYHDKHGRKRYMNCCRYYYRCWYNGRWTYDYCYHEKCDDHYYYY
jgi:hypothetical protein